MVRSRATSRGVEGRMIFNSVGDVELAVAVAWPSRITLPPIL